MDKSRLLWKKNYVTIMRALELRFTNTKNIEEKLWKYTKTIVITLEL